MPICNNCGKYIPDKNPTPKPKTEEGLIDYFRSLPCSSFTYCYECIIKLGLIKESEN